MINIFRKIRKQLADDNKPVKYMRYAFGEIVLVVIGILIALQINTLNRERINSKKEHKILVNLKKDLFEGIKLLDFHIEFEANVANSAIIILDNYAQNEGFGKIDSIYNLLNDFTIRATFEPTNATYQELISTGNVGLLSNDYLKSQMIVYYQEMELTALRTQNNNSNLVDRLISPAILSLSFFGQNSYSEPMIQIMGIDGVKNNLTRSDRLRDISKQLLSIDKNELLIINLVNFRLIVANYHKNTFVKLKKETEALLQLVNKEIDK